jgi:hypothetical protein
VVRRAIRERIKVCNWERKLERVQQRKEERKKRKPERTLKNEERGCWISES